MPYISPEARKGLFTTVLQKQVLLMEAVETATPGEMTYILTQLVLARLNREVHYSGHTIGFAKLRLWHGVIQAVADEFYDRLIAHYEHQKRIENGDVGYHELLKTILERDKDAR